MEDKKDLIDAQITQRELVNNERRLEGIFNQVSDLQVLWRVFPNGEFRIEKINDTYLNTMKMLGLELKREDVIGLTMDEMKVLLHGDPEIHERTRKIYLNAMNEGKREVYRESIELAGQTYVSENTITPIRNSEGEVEFLLFNSHDLTQLANTEKELRRSKERFELAMQASQDGLFDIKLDSNEIYLSPGWKHMVGYEEEELKDSMDTLKMLTSQEDYHRVQTTIGELVSKKKRRFEFEFQMKHKEGHWVDILSRGQSIENQDGEVQRIIGTHVDISTRKRLENNLRQSQKMESIGRLAGGIAHDFNNMLSVIIGLSEITLSKLDSHTELYSDIEEIFNAGLKSADLTNQLLAFSRKQASIPRVLNLNNTIPDLMKMLRRLIGDRVELVFKPDLKLWNINMDPTQVDQILTNLCINARDSMSEGGRIEIEVENTHFDKAAYQQYNDGKPGDYVLLTVSDNGSGMDEKTKEMVFEPFFTTKDLGQGTGLGLATVYGIIKQNNGIILVYSELDHGTCFKIYLPRYKSDKTEPRQETQYRVPKGNGEMLLVVEDEKPLLRMTKVMLESLGYEVLAASDYKKALELAEKHKNQIRVLVSDVIMPKVNGLQLAERIREILPKVKLLFMSGYSSNILSEHSPLRDDVHFVSKPFSQQQLAESVLSALKD